VRPELTAVQRREGQDLMVEEARLVSANGSRPGVAPGAPVFVLCNGRSGSTLLRFLLDAHPDLACPPETNLPAMAVQLATVWSLIEGAPLSAERGDEPPVIPEAAIAGVRQTMDAMTNSYLARRGKKRYCDKSLGAARFAPLLLRVYPEARFLCLYRHPMDVIASGIEACPWGLSGYGFDAYIAGTPGNAVWALARFWVDSAGVTMAAEEQFAESCHRVRYEDLVTDPEQVAAGVFEFLGVAQQPGISARCFSPERERFGPADYKIWHTSQVTADSVGRGWSVPAGMIPPPVTAMMRELTDKLGYLPVDEKWGTAAVPADLRVTSDDSPAAAEGAPGSALPQAALVGDALRAGLSRVDDRFARRWYPRAGESFTAVVTPPAGAGGGRESRWRVDMAARTVTGVTAPLGGDDGDGDDTAWDIVGSAGAWQAVLAGQVNLGVAMRRCELRYCETSEAGPVAADARIGMLADMLGLGPSWWSARRHDEPAEPMSPALPA
jgi:Sulfotransferase family